jgi:hypothetical protein
MLVTNGLRHKENHSPLRIVVVVVWLMHGSFHRRKDFVFDSFFEKLDPKLHNSAAFVLIRKCSLTKPKSRASWLKFVIMNFHLKKKKLEPSAGSKIVFFFFFCYHGTIIFNTFHGVRSFISLFIVKLLLWLWIKNSYAFDYGCFIFFFFFFCHLTLVML